VRFNCACLWGVVRGTCGSYVLPFLKPIQNGLVVCGVLYILTALMVIEGPLTRRKLIEPLLMAGLIIIMFIVVSLA